MAALHLPPLHHTHKQPAHRRDTPEPHHPGGNPMTAATRTCGWCKTPTDSAVEVGLIERNSLPAVARYACAPCMTQYRIKPITEHTGPFDGRPQYRTEPQPRP
jgi:hypothetical protein